MNTREGQVGRLAYRHLANKHKYLALRAEVNHFLTLVRQLNAAALALKEHDAPETQHTFEHVRQTMQESVERLATMAAKTETELAIETEACTAMHYPATTAPGGGEQSSCRIEDRSRSHSTSLPGA